MARWPALAAVLLLMAPLPGRADPACGRLRGGDPLTFENLLVPAGAPAQQPALDYRHRLQTTPLGWPLQATWCVWVEPATDDAAARRWEEALSLALREWEQVLPIERVADPERAQVRVWRRRPALALDGTGRPRASHGRAILHLVRVGGEPAAAVEPRVEVLISPGQRQVAIQATALHELGHAFGLWGHSEDPADGLAASPGARPILQLSRRDRATVRWLYRQSTPLRADP